MMKTITVFTPSYNRAHLLPRLYASLRAQTSKDFIWMIIDDGSTDATTKIVEAWKKEADFEIQYHYKVNGGMHTAHNLAYELIETELNVCIDSDDQMPDDAVEKIINIWKANTNPQAAGIIGLDADEHGKIIGTPIPENLKEGNLIDLYRKYNVTGDKKVVLRTDIVRKYPPYPEYKGEKLVPLGILYLMIGNDYPSIYTNEVLCWVEYQTEGSSHTIQKQYFQSPRGFAYAKSVQKKLIPSLVDQLKFSLHIGISALITKDFKLLNLAPASYLNWMMLPTALIVKKYLLWKTR